MTKVYDSGEVPMDPASHSPGLYRQELVGPHTYLCSTDGGNEDMESCLGIAELANGGYSITGNKPEDTGRELRGTVQELRDFYRHLSAIPEISGDAKA